MNLRITTTDFRLDCRHDLRRTSSTRQSLSLAAYDDAELLIACLLFTRSLFDLLAPSTEGVEVRLLFVVDVFPILTTSPLAVNKISQYKGMIAIASATDDGLQEENSVNGEPSPAFTPSAVPHCLASRREERKPPQLQR